MFFRWRRFPVCRRIVRFLARTAPVWQPGLFGKIRSRQASVPAPESSGLLFWSGIMCVTLIFGNDPRECCTGRPRAGRLHPAPSVPHEPENLDATLFRLPGCRKAPRTSSPERLPVHWYTGIRLPVFEIVAPRGSPVSRAGGRAGRPQAGAFFTAVV
jgi:hypothetical protein